MKITIDNKIEKLHDINFQMLNYKRAPKKYINLDNEINYLQNYKEWFDTQREKEKKEIEDRLFRMLERTALNMGKRTSVDNVEQMFDFSIFEKNGKNIEGQKRLTQEFDKYKKIQRQDTALTKIKSAFNEIDHETATNLLVAFDWDVNTAINNYRKNLHIHIKFIMPNKKSSSKARFTYDSTGMDIIAYLLKKYPPERRKTYGVKLNERDYRLSLIELSKTLYDLGLRNHSLVYLEIIKDTDLV